MSISSTTPPAQAPSAKMGRLKPASVVYWLRVLFAIVAAFANQILHIDQIRYGEFAVFLGVGLGVVIYAVTVLIVTRVLHYGEAELKGKNRYITLGGGTFIVIWIAISVLLYTLAPF